MQLNQFYMNEFTDILVCILCIYMNAVSSPGDSSPVPQSPTRSRHPLHDVDAQDDELPVISEASNSDGDNNGNEELSKVLTLHHLILDCSTWAHIDLTGIRTLRMVPTFHSYDSMTF